MFESELRLHRFREAIIEFLGIASQASYCSDAELISQLKQNGQVRVIHDKSVVLASQQAEIEKETAQQEFSAIHPITSEYNEAICEVSRLQWELVETKTQRDLDIIKHLAAAALIDDYQVRRCLFV